MQDFCGYRESLTEIAGEIVVELDYLSIGLYRVRPLESFALRYVRRGVRFNLLINDIAKSPSRGQGLLTLLTSISFL